MLSLLCGITADCCDWFCCACSSLQALVAHPLNAHHLSLRPQSLSGLLQTFKQTPMHIAPESLFRTGCSQFWRCLQKNRPLLVSIWRTEEEQNREVCLKITGRFICAGSHSNRFNFPWEICRTFRWFTAASSQPSVFHVRSSLLSMWRKGKRINSGWMMTELIRHFCSCQRQWMNRAAKCLTFKNQSVLLQIKLQINYGSFAAWTLGGIHRTISLNWKEDLSRFSSCLWKSPLSARLKTLIMTVHHRHGPVQQQQSWRGSQTDLFSFLIRISSALLHSHVLTHICSQTWIFLGSISSIKNKTKL